MPTKNKIVKLEDHVDAEFGIMGTKRREEFEEGYEAFKLGVMLQELRKDHNMTQEQLAVKCGTTKSYISKLENNVSDAKLSTLMRIVRDGFGVHLHFSLTS
jgi:DNA-binding XRE family transcriptional regulator